jgi:hypothetical protein
MPEEIDAAQLDAAEEEMNKAKAQVAEKKKEWDQRALAHTMNAVDAIIRAHRSPAESGAPSGV